MVEAWDVVEIVKTVGCWATLIGDKVEVGLSDFGGGDFVAIGQLNPHFRAVDWVFQVGEIGGEVGCCARIWNKGGKSFRGIRVFFFRVSFPKSKNSST